jgi:tRNA/rRNA methyltransferase
MILVRPQMGENIGAAARGMLNFGLDWMRIVAPRDGWPNPKAVAMASGAARVIDHARVTATVADAVADLGFVFATTARERELTKPVYTPEAAMAEARARIAAGERVGMLFGPERSGLDNDDILAANALVTVPADPAFSSLNLAQCVLLLAYEWRRSADATAPVRLDLGEDRMASRGEVERFVAALVARLDAAGFFHPETKRASMEANVRNLFARAPLTDPDLRTLYGIVRALDEGRGRRSPR